MTLHSPFNFYYLRIQQCISEKKTVMPSLAYNQLLFPDSFVEIPAVKRQQQKHQKKVARDFPVYFTSSKFTRKRYVIAICAVSLLRFPSSILGKWASKKALIM